MKAPTKIRPLILLAFMAFLPFVAHATIVERYLYTPAQLPSPSTDAGEAIRLISFAHISDVHITDEGNPVRAEELKLLVDSDPLTFLDLGIFLGSVIPPAHREMGIYTALVWDSCIKAINDEYLKAPFDFLFSTGDHTDTGIIDELVWFRELSEGRVPSNFKAGHANHLGQRTIRPENPEALLMPLYAAVGNHDIEYQGTFNNDGFIGVLVRNLAYDPDPDRYYINNLSFLDDVLEIQNGYGLSQDMQTLGYYSFDANPLIHCIVLNTAVYYAPLSGWPLEPLALGSLSTTQFEWMLGEIEQNTDKLCIIFAHHGPDEFFPLCDSLKYYISGARLKSALQAYDNVIAYIDGHTHVNHISAVATEQGTGYWDINTCGVADYPQEWRTISLFYNGDGTGMISCRMHGHNGIFGSLEPYIGQDTRLISLAELGEEGYTAKGLPEDRDVDLYFKVPDRIIESIQNSALILGDGPFSEEIAPQEQSNSTQSIQISDEIKESACFIQMAYF